MPVKPTMEMRARSRAMAAAVSKGSLDSVAAAMRMPSQPLPAVKVPTASSMPVSAKFQASSAPRCLARSRRP